MSLLSEVEVAELWTTAVARVEEFATLRRLVTDSISTGNFAAAKAVILANPFILSRGIQGSLLRAVMLLAWQYPAFIEWLAQYERCIYTVTGLAYFRDIQACYDDASDQMREMLQRLYHDVIQLDPTAVQDTVDEDGGVSVWTNDSTSETGSEGSEANAHGEASEYSDSVTSDDGEARSPVFADEPGVDDARAAWSRDVVAAGNRTVRFVMQLYDVVYQPKSFFQQAFPELKAIDVTSVCQKDPEMLDRFPKRDDVILYTKMYPVALLMLRYNGHVKWVYGCDMPCSKLAVGRWIERVRSNTLGTCDVCYRDDINDIVTHDVSDGSPIPPQVCQTCGIKLCGECFLKLDLRATPQPPCCFCSQLFSHKPISSPDRLRMLAVSHRAVAAIEGTPRGGHIDELCERLGV
ncbi:hypothetical protein WJX72_004824 [[Myrmecia] bisecta]|uniref:RING-type domain-containing protein n=1 Tax=[Myrmecia] bisecta TaxID=41462 RepID=A0AAW1PEH9_9CHLO